MHRDPIVHPAHSLSSSSRASRRVTLWEDIENAVGEPYMEGRSAVAWRVVMAERWARCDYPGVFRDISRAPVKKVTDEEGPFGSAWIEYWERPVLGKGFVLVPLKDRLVLRHGLEGGEVCIPYKDVLQFVYRKEVGTSSPVVDVLELTARYVSYTPSMNIGDAPVSRGGPGQLEGEAFVTENDTAGFTSSGGQSSSPQTSNFLDGEEKKSPLEGGKTWKEQREYLFMFHSSDSFTLPNDAQEVVRGLCNPAIGKMKAPLEQVFAFLSPRIAVKPLASLGPIRRFAGLGCTCSRVAKEKERCCLHSPSNCVASAFQRWLMYQWGCSVPLGLSSDEGMTLAGHPSRRSVAEVLGYAPACSAVLAAGAQSEEFGFHWEKDLVNFVHEVRLPASHAEVEGVTQNSTGTIRRVLSPAQHVHISRRFQEKESTDIRIEYGPTLSC